MENQQSQLHKYQQSLFTTSSLVRPMGLAGKHTSMNISQRQQHAAVGMKPMSGRATSLGRVVMNANLQQPNGNKNQTVSMSSQQVNSSVKVEKMTPINSMPQ